jgi:hypothetical protein
VGADVGVEVNAEVGVIETTVADSEMAPLFVNVAQIGRVGWMSVELPKGAKRKLEVVVLDHEVTSVTVATVQLGQQKLEGVQVSRGREDQLGKPSDSDVMEVGLGSMVRT